VINQKIRIVIRKADSDPASASDIGADMGGVKPLFEIYEAE
jgi:hypothetical protein